MMQKLILTTTTLLALSAGVAFAQQSNSDDQITPSGPNCSSAATPGCPQSPEDLNTQSGPGTTGADSQPSPVGQQDGTAPDQQQQGVPDGDVGEPASPTDNSESVTP